MVRTLPSVVPPKMYRHFAVVTVLLTTGIAMFAEGENREAAAAQVEQREEQEARPQESAAQDAKPRTAGRTPRPRHQFAQDSDAFDATFGAPMDDALGSVAVYATEALSKGGAQAGYSDSYIASLDAEERELLLRGLEDEGVLSPEERERKTAALVAASSARSGGSPIND